MTQYTEIQKIFSQIEILEKMFDFLRIVDPLTKKVITYYKNDTMSEMEHKCFKFWGKDTVCDNCVSMRAFNENQTFMKIDYTSNDEIYMTTAMPVELSNRRLVMELLKNITNSMIFENKKTDKSSEIYELIDSINYLALKDELTGVYNKRYINERLPVDLLTAALSGQSLSVIMADIDFFKKVNDNYGHLTGDYVLKSFAETLSQCVKRDSDWVARFGGEEFLICLPGASLGKAVEIAEYMRKSIEKKEIPCGTQTIKITSSFGVCCMIPAHHNNFEDLIECADRKLYTAKNNGRNRVEA